jgi:MFS family permease
MQKLPVSKWLSGNIILWGGITMALAGCGHFDSFLGLRFVLGALESCSTPAYLLITATWYTVEEQPIRIGWWSTFLGIANSFGGLLAFAIGHINGPLASWQYQFIIIGAISSFWGIFMFFKLAQSPSSAYVSFYRQ